MKTASAPNGRCPDAPREAAAYYIGKGLAPIPLPFQSKRPALDAWPDLRLTPDDLDVYFPADAEYNLGVLNGEPSGNTADADLDCDEARRAARFLMPPTGWVFGRKSAPRSHWIYRTDAPLDVKADEFKDLSGKMLVELRGNRSQTVFPPSVWRDKEPPHRTEAVRWDQFKEPGAVALVDLRRAVREVAAVALLARHWPDAGWHDATLALSGGLLRGRLPEERVQRLVEALWRTAGTRDKAADRDGCVRTTAEKIAAGEKVNGWPKLIEQLGENGSAVVARVCEWLGLHDRRPAATAGVTPEPAPWPDPPAPEAYHGLAGRIVHVIEPASEADPAALLAQTLVAFGSAAGRSAHFTVEADRHHGNEFVVLIGKTSKARKGTSWGRVSRLFEEADPQWAKERVQTGLSSGEGLIWAVRDPIQKRERVRDRGAAARYEEVEADPGVEDKRILVVEPEFANVLKQTERQGNNLSAVLRVAWDGRDLRSMTKNSPARATEAHVSLIGHVTADELRRYLTQTETANGYGNRHLWICADRSKRLPEGGVIDPRDLAALRGELAEALAFARSAGEIRRDPEARAVWHEVYGELSEGRPGLAGALLARAEAHVMRLAMLYAMLDQSALIRARHLLAALALWDYVERTVYHIFGDGLGDPVADDLLRLLRSCPNGLTRTDIRDYFQRHASADRIGRALGLLLQHRLARCEQEQTGGRPSERWLAAGGRSEVRR